MTALPRIIVTNDDCYLSTGLYLLYDAVRGLGETRIYSTELPRSAVGHTISLNKPLRIATRKYLGYTVYVTDGTPIDALHLALSLHGFKPDLLLSGVNIGENLALQHIFYSGTLAVAIEAALHGIPSIAFSADVMEYSDFEDERLRSTIKLVAERLASHVLERGLPEGVDVVSVNFPNPRRLKPCIRLSRAARLRWEAKFERRLDTRGRPYYWLQTIAVPAEPGTDVYTVTREGCVSVTPLNIDMNTATGRNELAELTAGIERALKQLFHGSERKEKQP